MSVNQSNLQELFKKFINNSISKKEFKMLVEYIKLYPECPELKTLIFEHIKTNASFNKELDTSQSDIIYQRILNNISNEEIKNKKGAFNKAYRQVLKIAAIFIVGFSLFYVIKNDTFYFNQENNSVVATPVIDENAITLTLDNGVVETIEESGAIRITNAQGNVIGKQEGNTLIYNNKSKTSEKTIAYNTLTVPYGTLFDIAMPDGTKIKLNAGSTITYPTNYIVGKNREVTLIGEAFFDVKKDPKSPFILTMNDDVGVRVLGTKFNASSYPEDDKINTVLVEGAVSIYKANDNSAQNVESVLKPNEIASWDKSSKNLNIEETDIDIHTAWMSGRIRFRHLEFKNIIKKLERKYDVEIYCIDEALNNETFTASFDIEPIEDVLEAFHKNHGLSYTIKNDIITIN
jgi:hypothetical protein